MKTTVLVACLSAALMTSMAIANETAKTLPAAQMTVATDANSEAIAILTAVNDHEMKAAEMALAKMPGDAVAKYAQMLHDEHTINQEKTRALADPADSLTMDTPTITALKEKSKAKREELSVLQADAFESAFIDAMVEDHTEILAKIDNELLPNATDAAVAGHLRDTRNHIAKHLEQAKKLDGNPQASR